MSQRGESEDSPFGLEELFFSRTDAHGIIQSGNGVFQRVSGYSWGELVGRPHKVIRHPDMPRGVFWLLWRSIQSGTPIGAYVKNRAKDGRYYWVFAIVSPVDGGYLSIRLKPGSEAFVRIQDEYAGLRQFEARERANPADSAAELLARLEGLGYSDYPAFMASALSTEIQARTGHLGRAPEEKLLLLDELSRLAQGLLGQVVAISAAYRENAYIPLNLRIQASQLGTEGFVIGEISKNFKSINHELNLVVARFEQSAQSVSQAICQGLFLICTATLQNEICEIFAGEHSSGGFCAESEASRLREQQARCNAEARKGLIAISRQTRAFRDDCIAMSRLAASLEVTRIMGKVETARVKVARTGLDALLEDLAGFHRALAVGLRNLEHANAEIISKTDAFLEAQARTLGPA